MEEIWIIGLGQFGYIAYQRLSAEAGKDRHFVLVDPVEEKLGRCERADSTLEISDGIEFLEKNLEKANFWPRLDSICLKVESRKAAHFFNQTEKRYRLNPLYVTKILEKSKHSIVQ